MNQEFWITVRNYKPIIEKIVAVNTRIFLDFAEFDYDTYVIQGNFAFGFLNPLYVTPVPSRGYIRIYGLVIDPIPYEPIQGSIVVKIVVKPITSVWTLPSLWEQSIIRDSRGQVIPAVVTAWNSPIMPIKVPEFRVIPYPIPERYSNEA